MNQENKLFRVSFFCVIPNELTVVTCPKDLLLAYECCKENGFSVCWVSEELCIKYKPCKTDVFILSEFVGPLFEFLRPFECTIIGPQCLLVSVSKGQPLPEVSTPVFTVAMRGITVTTTGCTSQEKMALQEKVQFMGGLYSSLLSGKTTHLITKSVDSSLKFKLATDEGIPIMTPNWIDAVWNASLKESVHGTDPMFTIYVCPPFQGLVVCVSQTSAKDREALKKIIEANGGRCSDQLEMGKTNILITTSAEGEEYTDAKRWKIRCLKPEWIYMSLDKGYPLETDMFLMKNSTLLPRCSTKEADPSVKKNDNSVSKESRVQHSDEVQSTHSRNFKLNFQSTDALRTSNFAMTESARPFLGGCQIFFSGFDGSQLEKLRHAVNKASGSVLNKICKWVTHVVIGEIVEGDWKTIQQLMPMPFVLTVEWVAESFRLERSAEEKNYLHPDFKNKVDPNNDKASKGDVLEPSISFEADVLLKASKDIDVKEFETIIRYDRENQAIFGQIALDWKCIESEEDMHELFTIFEADVLLEASKDIDVKDIEMVIRYVRENQATFDQIVSDWDQIESEEDVYEPSINFKEDVILEAAKSIGLNDIEIFIEHVQENKVILDQFASDWELTESEDEQ